MPGKRCGHALRKGRHSEPGRVYLVTSVTRNRSPVFAELSAARCLVHSLIKEQEIRRAATLAYVVMPDHLHWLFQLGGECRVVGSGARGPAGRGDKQSIINAGFAFHRPLAFCFTVRHSVVGYG